MFDNLREEYSSSPLFHEEPVVQEKRTLRTFLRDLGPVRRFAISLLLFVLVALVGAFVLLSTNRIVLPA